MHERTERALCRLAFLMLCALPTLITIAFTLLTWTPWYHNRQIRNLELVLSQRLGVRVAISDMRRPTPGSWQLVGVELADPETQAIIGKVREVSYARVNDLVVLRLLQPELQASQLPLVWRIVHDRFLCQPELLGQGLKLWAQDLSVHSHPQGLTLSPVDIWIEPTDDQTRALARFSLAGWDPSEVPATVTVTRFRAGETPRTEWELKTGTKPLPCSVLADYLPVMRRLGLDAEFKGLLRWKLERDDYTVELAGAKFSNVNMLELFEPLDFHVSGKGTIELQSLVRHSGRPVSEAAGKLTIQGGRIEVGLLRRLAGLFKADLLPMNVADNERLDYQLIATQFQLYGNDVQIAGICSLQPSFESSGVGSAVIAYDRPVLSFDPRNRVSSNQLTSTIDPSGRTGIPVGTDQNWARGLLPQLGRQRASHEAEEPPKVGRLRMQRGY